METRQAIHIMIRAYAAILFSLGCLAIVLTAVALLLAFGPLDNYARWAFAFAYQLGIWGVIQIISGLFLFLVRRGLIRFILAKEAEE